MKMEQLDCAFVHYSFRLSTFGPNYGSWIVSKK